MSEKYHILQIDPLLKPFAKDIELRMTRYREMRHTLTDGRDTLSSVVNAHLFFGFHPTDRGWFYREWAPNADEITLLGDFNNWNKNTHKLKKHKDYWEIFVDGEFPHGSKVKIQIKAKEKTFERIPLFVRRLFQDPQNKGFDGVIWNPNTPFDWTDQDFHPRKPLMIYECHVGMSGEREGVSTFAEFTENVLPRINKLGYNAIQIMAIMEHPYYGSFGYQVTNFFAVSSRFGTPEDFKALVNAAHKMGIAVIMDVVHSHVAKNTNEGLSEFDGTDYQFCHSGPKGNHPAWGTRLFDYGKPAVLHFLLSNLKYWLTEYHLDGFRFDGVTSMLYHHHGLGVAFNNYDKYFSMNTDVAAITYLQLAAALCKELNRESVLIAEDMSGMPGMCLPIGYGGIGFDYRLSMGLPDFFIRTLKEKDENWSMGGLWHELTWHRQQEKVINYCESHDQALVGDKTIMFWLADSAMYWNMEKDSKNEIIKRAVSLHKMIRFITCSCGGDGYLNFMGNEFGHPEWVDFPREGNNWSYHYARRLWSLADNSNLKYQYLLEFDSAMLKLMSDPDIYNNPVQLLKLDESGKIIAFIRGAYTFVFNFHPNKSYLHALNNTFNFQIVLHSAWKRFDGFVDERNNIGILRNDGLVADPRTAVVIKYLGE